jgi:signal transduction histidine kinase
LVLEGASGFECRIIRPDGGLRHVAGFGEVVRDGTEPTAVIFGTLQDTTELRQKERELQEKNAEMERFTYMISHDLKSPLVTIRTFLGYLEQDMASSDAARIDKDIFYMRTAAEKMGQLLDELLEMSRVGRVVNPSVRISFRELVKETLGLVAGPIAEKKIEVLVADEEVSLYGDLPRMVEIWQNLVENAVKFMGDQSSPRIEIGVEKSGKETVFFIRDNGIGIEPKYSDKIFGLFEKLALDSEGTGLGLALVRRIVEMNGGKIWMESEGLGKGACFRFTLPEAVSVTGKGEHA